MKFSILSLFTNFRDKGFIFRLCLLSLVAFLVWDATFDLGAYPFWPWDEAVYAQVAKQSSGIPVFSWLGYSDVPQAQVWFEKPPLHLWLVRLCFFLLGESEFAGRMPSALYALGCFWLVYKITKKITKHDLHSIIAICVLIYLNAFSQVARFLGMDTAVAFWVLLGIYAIMKSTSDLRYTYVLWLALAGGFLTKNLVGLLSVFAIPAFVFFSPERMKVVKSLSKSSLLFLMLVTPWLLLESAKFGQQFWDIFLMKHVFGRFIHGMGDVNTGPWNFYLFPFQDLTLGVLTVMSLIYAFIAKKKYGLNVIVLLLVLFFGVMLLSFSKGKILAYMTFVYPLLAILGALLIGDIIQLIKNQRVSQLVLLALCGVGILTGISYHKSNVVLFSELRSMDIQKIGRLLEGKNWDNTRIFYVGLYDDKQITQNYPSLVYYSGRYVREVYDLPERRQEIFRTTTHLVFRAESGIYVKAIRHGF